MQKILEDILKKRGVKLEELREDEKIDFDRWSSILDEGDVTVDKIQRFCSKQIKMIENKWNDLDSPSKNSERLVVIHTVYRAILKMIKAKEGERSILEAYLTSLLHES
jgi:hypothetical protein